MAGVGALASMTGAGIDPWRFNAHPDTWFVIASAGFAYWYALTRIGPRIADPAGSGVGRGRFAVVTRRQVMSFCAGLLVVELASDWPLHDLAENYLYGAHMVQHMLISLVAPPLLLLGIPGWLTRHILRSRGASGTVRVVCRPVMAGLMFNTVIAVSHAPFWVDATLYHHFLHFWAHLLLFTVALIMWFPVVNKLPDFPTLTPPGKMVYLFFQSILPNVPAAFLVLSTGVIYKYYGAVPHPFAGLDLLNDQQLAGAVMKVGGTFFFWGIIVVMFFRWAASQHHGTSAAADRAASAAEAELSLARNRTSPGVLVGGAAPSPAPAAMPDILTWDDVAQELANTHPAQPGP
jgi:putative membrane protein